MLSTRLFFVNHVKMQHVYNYINCVYYGSSTRGQGKMMQKLLSKNQPKRKWFVSSKNPPFAHTVTVKKELSGRRLRRMVVLDKLFMRYISDIMTTDRMSTTFVNRGIEITFVKVASDYNLVNVYWIAKSDEDHEHSLPTEELLNKFSVSLRHELSQLQIIGVVPPIKFVKDKNYLLAKEVENRLAIADLGNNDESSINPWELIEHTSGTEECKGTSSFKSLSIEKDENNLYEVKLPEMRHDVLGFDHHKIMTKIKASLNKAQKVTKKSTLDNPNEISASENSFPLLNSCNQQLQDEMLINFLNKRKVEEKRKFKLKNKSRTDPQMLNIDENYYPSVLEDNNVEEENNIFIEDDR